MKHEHGKKVFKIIGMVIAGIAIAVLFAFVFGLAVQYLWNFIVPDLFGLKAITYWEAFALLLLAKLLFGSFGPHGRHYNGNGPWKRWRHSCGEPGIPREQFRYYHDFWRNEGRKAFDEYMKRVAEPGDK
jgi:hypothetical protein